MAVGQGRRDRYDEIELLAFLKRPGKLQIQLGDKIVVSQPGQYSVLDKNEYANMLYHSGVISPAARK